MKEFTIEELKKYNGMMGRRAYVAFEGKVYDITNSDLWKNGMHFQRHLAGRDLTEQLKRAPHSEKLIKKFPVVGRLKIE